MGKESKASPLDALNARQRRFVELLAGGMAAGRAYEQAGYSVAGDKADQSASRMLRNDKVSAALASIQKSTPQIADRAERQQFWTEVMRDPDEDMKHRLKAAELLGKAGADFIARHEHKVESGLRVVLQTPDNGRGGG
jgi:hypothetical protein